MKKERAYLASSGDKLVNWHFQQIISFLKNKKTHVYILESLRDPNNRQLVLYGFIDFCSDKTRRIYLNNAKICHRDRNEMTKTLIHEVIHGLTDVNGVSEINVCILENILWERFTKEQKRMIASHLPKHIVKTQPTAQQK